MIVPAPDNEITLALVETAAAFTLSCAALLVPRFGSKFFTRMERFLVPLARRKRISVLTVGTAALLLRLLLLPLFPVPLPFVPDDFSFLLQADTFLHGRLTNPTPPLWTHFETIHVTLWPTYQSMYFPAQALLLAAGKLLFGQPWFGVLAMTALMCAAICWMLQAWLPPAWALLGGLLAVLRIGLFSYWINTYTGAAPICAFAGALILGALPRLMKKPRLRYSLAMALGAALLVISRPFEGLLLCLPTAGYLLWWIAKGNNRPRGRQLVRLAFVPAVLLMTVCVWLGYYDARAFGSPLTLPYTVDRAEYAVTPYYVWQRLKPMPAYRHQSLRAFYADPPTGSILSSGETDEYHNIHSAFWGETFKKFLFGLSFFGGGALLPPLIMTRRLFLDRRIRFLLFCVLLLAAGMGIELYLLPHYLAPFAAAFYALGLQAMRHLRVMRFDGQPAGQLMVRLLVTLCVVLAAARAFSGPLHIRVRQWPGSRWSGNWYGPEHWGIDRAAIESRLERMPAGQLAIVACSPKRSVLDEWVYNAADIDDSKVIWARDMGAEKNAELIRYYHDRRPWLVNMNTEPATLSPYPAQEITPAQTK